MRQAAAEAGRLDAEAADGAAEGDRAQLRHDVGDQAVRQGRVDEVLVGAHALHVGGLRLVVDRDHAVETRDVEARCARGRARPEEVGGLLRQPHRLTGRDRGVRRRQARDRCLVGRQSGRARNRNLLRRSVPNGERVRFTLLQVVSETRRPPGSGGGLPGQPASGVAEVDDDALAPELADGPQVGLARSPPSRTAASRPRAPDATPWRRTPRARSGRRLSSVDGGRGVRAAVEVAHGRALGRRRPGHGGSGQGHQLLVLSRQVGHAAHASGRRRRTCPPYDVSRCRGWERRRPEFEGAEVASLRLLAGSAPTALLIYWTESPCVVDDPDHPAHHRARALILSRVRGGRRGGL